MTAAPTGAPPAQRARPARALIAALALLIALLAGLIASLMIGTAGLAPAAVLAALRDALTAAEPADIAAHNIVVSLRLPRALVAIAAGAHLAIAGVLLQAMMRNPLAAPNIVGVTAGAGFTAAIALLIFPAFSAALPPAAFLGALIAGATVYMLSWRPGVGTSPMRMVLAGVAVTAMLAAATTFLMIVFADRVQSVVLWMSGSLIGRSWNHAALIAPYSLVGVVAAILLARQLDVLQVGEEQARTLGMRVELIRALTLLCATLLAAAAVSVTGLIGFIGLVVPHIMRLLGFRAHLALIPLAALGGAALLLWADLLARTVISPREIPVGVLTALIGGPYFLFLLRRTKLL